MLKRGALWWGNSFTLNSDSKGVTVVLKEGRSHKAVCPKRFQCVCELVQACFWEECTVLEVKFNGLFRVKHCGFVTEHTSEHSW